MQASEGTWREFEQWVSELRSEFGGRGLLFRGQGNSLWPLETTLERQGQKNMSFRDYHRLITGKIGPAVETFTGVSVPQYDRELQKEFEKLDSFFEANRFPSGSLYRYVIYLRHHGFPSPLLDWSNSAYVAVFFAHRYANPNVEKRSIYAYCESPSGAKGGAVGEPTIHTLGSYVRSHPRHFRQQSAYTVCESFNQNHGWRYDSHQYVFDHARPGQDFLWRFDLSSEQRVPTLKLLNDYNLNAYSLFDTEETLLETMWLREQVLEITLR